MDELFTVMKWPLVACLLLPGLLVYLGLHIVRREIIFVDLALAQVAALGTCVAILVNHDPAEHEHGSFDWHSYAWSVGFTLAGAIIFTLTRNRKHHQVPQEALIGIIYVVAAASGILLLSKGTGGDEELKRTLVGDFLQLQKPADVFRPFGLYAVIGIVHFVFRRQFLAISFEPEQAEAGGLSVRWWDFLFYALFGLVVTTFVRIGGVLLVFSYLIIPAVCANFLARKLTSLLAIGWVIAVVASLAGMVVSVKVDLPIGATIVCTLGATLVAVIAFAKFRPNKSP